MWNLVTWFFGLPSSSVHALFGGLIGAALVGAGIGVIDVSVVMSRVILPSVFAPVGVAVDALLGVAFIVVLFVRSATDRVDHAGLEQEVNAAGEMVTIKKVKPKKKPRSRTA